MRAAKRALQLSELAYARRESRSLIAGHLGWQNALLQTQSQATPPAFVFDIDGVLIKGKTVLEQAKRAIQSLYDQGQSPKYPICFLTNGGGVLESTKAQQLSSWLNVNIQAEQVVLSHTPFKTLSNLFEKAVLLVGRHDLRIVAKSYGFKKAITTAELAALNPDAVPFARGQLGTVNPAPNLLSFGKKDNPISAILVFSDPSNWYLDLQLMFDLITSGGILGKDESKGNPDGVQVYFSNPDFVFANEFASPRFGQGALTVALQALLEKAGEPYPATWRVFGKPNAEPYRLAAAILDSQAEALGWKSASASPSVRPYNIFMIGGSRFADNPASDVAGARNAGRPWYSILVRTGVFRGQNSSQPPADLVVDDVEQAVAVALNGQCVQACSNEQ